MGGSGPVFFLGKFTTPGVEIWGFDVLEYNEQVENTGLFSGSQHPQMAQDPEWWVGAKGQKGGFQIQNAKRF